MSQLVRRGDAFVLRPSLDPSFVRWLWQFWRSSSPARFDAGVRALLELNRRTLELYDGYREAGIEFETHSTGLVVVARTTRRTGAVRQVFRRLRELGYEGGEPDELDRDALVELEPALDRSNVVAGLHARVDRYVRPEELMDALARRLREEGAQILGGLRGRRSPTRLRTAGRSRRTTASRARREGGGGRRAPVRPGSSGASGFASLCNLLEAIASRLPEMAHLPVMRSISPRRRSASAPTRKACGSPACSSSEPLARRRLRVPGSACSQPRARTSTAGGPRRGRAGRHVGRGSSCDRGRPSADRSAARACRPVRRLGTRNARITLAPATAALARPARARGPHGAGARAVRRRDGADADPASRSRSRRVGH